jgi:hypothetical protein
MAERDRNFKNDALSNNALSDVEKFLFLLSDLKIIDADKTELETASNSRVEEPDEPDEPILESLEPRRSPIPYAYPSLLDELPFLQNIPPVVVEEIDQQQPKVQTKTQPRVQNLDLPSEALNILDGKDLPIAKAKE